MKVVSDGDRATTRPTPPVTDHFEMRSQLSEDFKSLKLNGSLKWSDSFNCWREHIRSDENRHSKKNCDELSEIKTILISVNLRPCKVINIISPHYPSLSIYLYPNSTLHKQQPAILTDKSIRIATLCIGSKRHLRLRRAHDYNHIATRGGLGACPPEMF